MTTTTPRHWWKPASAINQGDRLGDLVQGLFQPAAVVLHVTIPPGSNQLRRIATAAGTFVVQADAQFYVFDAEVAVE